MSISIDWGTKIITVPKAYTALVQSSPTEIREMPINQFRLDLKALEAGAEGIPHIKTHRHNTEVLLGGIVYARTVEIISGYTVTFEDGQYAVNLNGANSNIGDVVNVNQVSVRSANSAGLISNTAIEFSSFDGGVHIDASSPFIGTVYPTGTAQQKVNNLADAVLIAERRGFNKLIITGDFTFGATDSIADYEIYGDGLQSTHIVCVSGARLYHCEFFDTELEGEATGIIGVTDSFVHELLFDQTLSASETIFISRTLIDGELTLPPIYTGDIKIIDSYSNVAGVGTPTINFNNCSSDAIIRNWSGGIAISAASQGNDISIDLHSGSIKALSSNTDAVLNCRGIGTLTDSSTGSTVVLSDGLINRETIALAEASDFGFAQGSGNGINQIQLRAAAASSNAAYDPSMIIIRSGTGAGQGRMVYNYNGTTKTATVDRNWKTQPDATSYYAVMPKPGREHVNEGLALSATSSTITLNSLAADLDEIYTGQTIFIRSGTGEDQAKTVLSYDGTSHVATVDAWIEVPDTTSAYVMLPSGTGGGGGGGSTWSVAEKNQIRSALGVDGTKVDAISGQLQENTVATKVAAHNAEEVNLKVQ